MVAQKVLIFITVSTLKKIIVYKLYNTSYHIRSNNNYNPIINNFEMFINQKNVKNTSKLVILAIL